MSFVLEQITKHWIDLIAQAKEDKWEKFGAQAAEANEFYQSDNHSFLFSRNSPSKSGLVVNSPGGKDSDPRLTFEATANLTANVVSLFLPVLYHKNPNRVLRARTPAIPPGLLAQYRQAQAQEMMAQIQQAVTANPQIMMDPQVQQIGMQLEQKLMDPGQQGPSVKQLEDQIRAALIEAYLNYTPGEMDLKRNARDAIIEAIVKGLGLLWVTVDNTGDRAIACLEYDSVDHLFKDPDAEKSDECMWIVRRRKRPNWEIERDFGLEPGTLKGSDTSSDISAAATMLDDMDREYEESQGKTSDLSVYYEVYSRMGVGGRLKGFVDDNDEELMTRLEEFGDHCFLAICPTHPEHPLNLPPEVVDFDETGEETAARLQWPIPTYKNRKNPWPFAGLEFRKKSRCSWPMSYVGPALGYQKCINWILSFLMSRVKLVSRAFLLMPDGLDDEVYDTILNGSDLSLIKIKNEHPGAFEKFMEIVKMPSEDGNVWNLLAQLKREYEDATGANELNLSARTDTQMRSAAEVDLKRDVLSVRPNDMAAAVDAWMSDAAKLEAIAARYLLTAEDIAPIFGEEQPAEADMGMGQPVMQYGESTQLWLELVATDDVDRIVSEYEYTVESGSTRKPDKTQQVQNIDEGGQLVLAQFLQVWQQTGDPSKFNDFVEEWAKTREMANWQVLLLPDMRDFMMQQQMMMAAQAGGGSPGGGESAGGEQSPADGSGQPQPPPNGGPQ